MYWIIYVYKHVCFLRITHTFLLQSQLLDCNILINHQLRKHSPISSSRSSQTRPTPPWPLRSENTHRTPLIIFETELFWGHAFGHMLCRVPFGCNLPGLRNWHDQERCFARDSLFVFEKLLQWKSEGWQCRYNFTKIKDVNLAKWLA